MKHYLALLTGLVLLASPTLAYAHAVPVSSEPESSSVRAQAPSTVSIVFSERIDVPASSLVITSPSGTKISSAAPHQGDTARTLVTELSSTESGSYRVDWSVVSSDDGHFTKGAFAFAVGTSSVPLQIDDSAALVQITTMPEAFAMTVELMGNGFIWATILLFAFAIRPLMERFRSEESLLIRGYRFLIALAGVCVVAGGVAQVLVKSSDLAALRSGGFLETIPLYLQTSVGEAILVRAIAACAVCIIALFAARRIVLSPRFTAYEYALVAGMLVFAFFRAVISHATANLFHPWFSVAVNTLHVIEKDAWAGIVGVLLLLLIVPRTRPLVSAMLVRASALLSANLALVALTATYIVWLHLKVFSNLFTTQWGAAFLPLLITAVLLVGVRTYHMLARAYRPALFAKLALLTFGAEFALATLVVYFSSVVIITSPPLANPPAAVFSARDQGASISLTVSPFEDNAMLLTVRSAQAGEPAVTISGSGSDIAVELSQRFAGGYTFPTLLLATGEHTVHISVPQSGRYDAQASFAVRSEDIVPPADWQQYRHMDAFTLAMCGIALMALAYALLLHRYTQQTDEVRCTNVRGGPAVAFVVIVVSMYACVALISVSSNAGLFNPYKARCEADGNMWHLMLPTKAGVPISSTSREGCMWGMGKYQYMFPDSREYEYNSSYPKAAVTLDTTPGKLVAGVPSTLTVALKEPDGTPAHLLYDMEKLVHMVIVSEDQTAFAHIHADDTAPLSAEAIRTSTFTFKHTFPKAGKYIIAIDYAHGVTLESKQFVVDVAGAPVQSREAKTYASPGAFAGYQVALDYQLPLAGEVTTLKFTFSKDGKPAQNLEQYLSAAMHIAVVKNDFSAFVHTHGEIHPPGVPYPPIIVKNGQVVHSMQSMYVPPRFGPTVEAHLIFPSPGLYTVWGEFKVDGRVVPASFTIRVEQ